MDSYCVSHVSEKSSTPLSLVHTFAEGLSSTWRPRHAISSIPTFSFTRRTRRTRWTRRTSNAGHAWRNALPTSWRYAAEFRDAPRLSTTTNESAWWGARRLPTAARGVWRAERGAVIALWQHWGASKAEVQINEN